MATCPGRSTPYPSGRLACPHRWGRMLLKVAAREIFSGGALDVRPEDHLCGRSKLLDSTLCPDLEQQGEAARHMWLCSTGSFWAEGISFIVCVLFEIISVLIFLVLTGLPHFWTDISEIISVLIFPVLTGLTHFWTDLSKIISFLIFSILTDLPHFWIDLTEIISFFKILNFY